MLIVDSWLSVSCILDSEVSFITYYLIIYFVEIILAMEVVLLYKPVQYLLTCCLVLKLSNSTARMSNFKQYLALIKYILFLSAGIMIFLAYLFFEHMQIAYIHVASIIITTDYI